MSSLKWKIKMLSPAALLLAALTYKVLNINTFIPLKDIQDSENIPGNPELTELHTFSSSEGTIVYRKSGTGAPVVLLHDLSCASAGSEWLATASLLAQKYTVYIPDLPGCGASDGPKEPFTSALYMTFLDEFLTAIVGEPCHFVCMGLSAAFVLPSMQMHPEYYNQVTLINPAFTSKDTYKNKMIRTVMDPLLQIPEAGNLFYGIRYSEKRITSDLIDTFYFNAYKNYNLYKKEALANVSGNSTVRTALFLSLLRGNMNMEAGHLLQDPKVPIRILYGEKDISASMLKEKINELNPCIPQKILSRTGHMPQLEDPEGTFLALIQL